MKRLLFVLLVSISFCAKAQVKDTVHVADTVAFISLSDFDSFLRSKADAVSHTDWVKMQTWFIELIKANEEKRKIKKK